ncbi:hypothetical protein [Micromonospora wenchangensis]|uniref:hypothetical protein n=1 Tax=Micromonospora wenchangensis TaxID=1185415 RepID=UPI0038233A92
MRNPFTTKQTIGVTLGTLFVLCCCGGGIVGAVSDTGKPKPAAAPAISATVEARKLGGVVDATASPTDTPSPAEFATISATPQAEPTRAPAVKKTTSPPHTTAPKPKPKPKPTPVKTTAPSVQKGVHPGAFCSPRGALGRTSKGTLMRCGPSATDERNRWRAA